MTNKFRCYCTPAHWRLGNSARFASYVTSKHLRRKSFATRYDTDENVTPRTLALESWHIRRISKRMIGGNRFECRINLFRARDFILHLESIWQTSFFLHGNFVKDFNGKIFYTHNIIIKILLILALLKNCSIFYHTSCMLSKYCLIKYKIKISIFIIYYILGYTHFSHAF